MTFKTMTIDELCVSPFNVRKNKRDANAITGMAESLFSRGQLYPLVVHPMPRKGREKQIYGALAGGRRLRAFRKLIDEGRLPANHRIDVIVREAMTQGEIEEISLIENINRVDLRPYERYKAVADAHAHGRAIEDIAEGTGQTVRAIRQWIRLGNLAPAIFEAFAEERISEGHAMAFAATEDQALQLHAFEQFMQRSEGERSYPHSVAIIRRLLKVGDAEQQKLLLFVGEAVYREAGGRFEMDLFADEAEMRGRVQDEGLLVQLADAKLARAKDRLRAQAGRNLRFGADYPRDGHFALIELEIAAEWLELDPAEAARLEELHAEMDELRHRAAQIGGEPGSPYRTAAIAALDREYAPLEQEAEAIEAGRQLVLPDGDIFGTLVLEEGGELEVRWWWSNRKARRAAEKLTGKASTSPVSTGIIGRPTGSIAIDDSASPGARQQADAIIKEGHGLGKDGVEVMRSIRQAMLRAALLDDARNDGIIARDYLLWGLARDRLTMPSAASDRGLAGLAIRHDVLPPLVNEHLGRTEAQRIWREAVERLKAHLSMTADDMLVAFRAFHNESREWKNEAAAIVAGCALERSCDADGYRIDLHDYVASLTGYDAPAKMRSLVEPTEEMAALMPRERRLEWARLLVPNSTYLVWEKLKAADLVEPFTRALRQSKTWVHPLLFFRSYNKATTAPAPSPSSKETAAI